MPLFDRSGFSPLAPSPRFAVLLGLALLTGAPPRLTEASELPPAFQLEWSTVPSGGSSSVPLRAATDVSGNVYVSQRGPQQITSFTATGGFRLGWRLPSIGCPTPQPYGIDLDAAGSSYAVDFGCSRLFKFKPDQALDGVAGGPGSGDGRFGSPTGVALGPDGSVYVADTYNQRIQKFDPGMTFLLQWGSPGNGPGQFDTPFDVAVDAVGRVYVLDSYNQRIQVFDASGAFLRAFGEPGIGPDHLLRPQGLDVTAEGTVYVADTENHQIVKFSPDGERLTSWGTQGSDPGQMIAPNDVAVDASGNVYVVDSGNKRVQKFAPVFVSLRVEPRTLNVKSGGTRVTANIEPPPPYRAADIDVGSLRLNRVAVDTQAAVAITDVDGDGILELTVSFSRAAIIATATPGASQLPLVLTGAIAGVALEGRDVIKLVGNDLGPLTSSLRVNAPLASVERLGRLELRDVTPNPAKAGARLFLSLRGLGQETALVEVIDLLGRRVDNAALSPGNGDIGRLSLQLGRSMAPGVYLVRVTQGRSVATGKFAVLE
jgi:sugar lactone lactonase YvrE